MLAPPRPPSRPDDLEALIREARARQRRRLMAFAGGVAAVAAVGLSLWTAIPGRSGGEHATSGGETGAPSRGIGEPGRVPIVEVGTSGGVTWAMNGLGLWLTTNGGRTWRASSPRHVREMGDLMARVEQVDFLDRRHGWLLAVDVRGGLQPAWRRHAELDWTSDGGRTWHWTMPEGCCGYVSFLNPRRGFFLGSSTLLATKNGGRSWQPVGPTPFRYGAPTFVDARHGIALAGGSGRLFSTSNGGKTWASAHIPRRVGVLPTVAAFGKQLVVPAARIGTAAPRLVVYVSGDGGATWQVRTAPKSTPMIPESDASGFSAVTRRVWYATRQDKLAVTTDAGRVWRRVKTVDLPRHWTITAIDFTAPKVGWAVFQLHSPPSQSVLMRTTDGGVHWKPAGPRAQRHHQRG